MMRRRGAVHRESEPGVIEVGLDELLRPGYEAAEDDPAQNTEDNDADPVTFDEWRADRPDPAGVSLGAAFFGWLVAGGTAVLLLTLVGAVGTLIGWDKLADWPGNGSTSAGWRGISVWLVLVLSMGIGSFSGGYASGRMVPSHGGRQGLAVWFVGWSAAGVIVGLGYLADRKYDLVATVDWPSLPLAEADRTAAAVVAVVAILLVTLVGAVLGGSAGNIGYARLNQTNHSVPGAA